jgi:hypothetical protein
MRGRGTRAGAAARTAGVDSPAAVVDPPTALVDAAAPVDPVAVRGGEAVELAPPHPATNTAIATPKATTPRIAQQVSDGAGVPVPSLGSSTTPP